MPQVLNRSKNASNLINGIKFTPGPKGAISDEITQEQADYFLKMPNYVAVKPAKTPAAPPAPPQDDTAADEAAAAERQTAAEVESAAAVQRQAEEEAAAEAAAKQGQKQQA
jgi:hypothetical protein